MTGTFRLSHNGQYTAFLSWNADSASIQSALEALPSIGTGNVTVTVSAPTTFSRSFSITFRNARGGQNINQVQILNSNVVATGGTISWFAQTLVNGITTTERQSVQIAGWNTSNQGDWSISYGSEVSTPLSPSASAADVANALNAFVALDGITVTGTGTGGFQITFGGIHVGLNMLQVRVDTTNLRLASPLRTITSSYNTDSELMSVSDPSATINYVRDNLGRATTIQNILGTFIGQQFTFHQSFNAVDQRTELRAVHGNNNDFRNTYAYDNLRRLTQIVQTGQSGSAPVVDKRVSFEYNTQGLRSKLSRFESTSSAHPVATTDYSYDTTKRLTGIAHKQGTTNLNTYSLIYDDMHRITSITSTLDGKVDFDYDKRSQLTSVIDTTASGGYNDVSQTLAYDQRGNRTGTGYTVNSDNRLTAAPNGVGMTYDNEGNLTSVTSNGSTQKLLEWDHRNRLTRVTVGSVVVTYEYDAFNRMVKRSQSGTFNNTYFAYDEGINPLLQWESYDNRLSHRYLWSDSVDELLADEQFLAGMTAPNTKWAMTDHQGTIKDIVDYNPATGVATVDRHRKYDPFGDRRGAALPTDIVFGYTGKYFDEVTGLQNNWNRWYDPKQGRFISQDPIGFAGGDENLYRYVGNSPTNATDPSGLIDPRVITLEELKDLKEVLPPLSGETEQDYLASLNVVVRRQPDDFVEEFDYSPFGMHGSIHLTDDYFLRRNLPVPTMVCHGMSAMGRVGPVNSFRFEHAARMQEYIETQYVFANIALVFVPLPIGKAPSSTLSRGAQLRQKFGSQFDEYARFRSQGYSPAAAKRLIQPYTGDGQHFIQQSWIKNAVMRYGTDSLRGRLLARFKDSPLNVVSGRNMNTGRFYEYHARIHGLPAYGRKSAQGMRMLRGEPWKATNVSPELVPYGRLGYIWHGSPTSLKLTAGGFVITTGAGIWGVYEYFDE